MSDETPAEVKVYDDPIHGPTLVVTLPAVAAPEGLCSYTTTSSPADAEQNTSYEEIPLSEGFIALDLSEDEP